MLRTTIAPGPHGSCHRCDQLRRDPKPHKTCHGRHTDEMRSEMIDGSVVSLWRYPVKSMMGEELNATEVTERGLLGDRAYALVDISDGKVATAKTPRKWPRLFDFRATVIEPARAAAKAPRVRIALPDGTTVTSD